MNKREYIQANKDWLEAKSKEDGVKALPKGIYYKVLVRAIRTARNRLSAVSSQPTTRVGRSTASSSTAAVAVCHWLADSVT